MLTNSSKLKGRIVEQGYNIGAFCAAIAMSESTFRSRLLGKTDFKMNEVATICDKLGISTEDMVAYFFAPNVPNSSRNDTTDKEATQ